MLSRLQNINLHSLDMLKWVYLCQELKLLIHFYKSRNDMRTNWIPIMNYKFKVLQFNAIVSYNCIFGSAFKTERLILIVSKRDNVECAIFKLRRLSSINATHLFISNRTLCSSVTEFKLNFRRNRTRKKKRKSEMKCKFNYIYQNNNNLISWDFCF